MVIHDWETFKRVFWHEQTRNCHVVIDEVRALRPKQQLDLRDMLLKGRHRGHLITLIGQRAIGMDKSSREQCSELVTFNISLDDAEELVRTWNCPQLLQAAQLPQLHYIKFRRMGLPQYGIVKF